MKHDYFYKNYFYKQINSVQKCMQEWLDVHKPNANVYVKMISDWLH